MSLRIRLVVVAAGAALASLAACGSPKAGPATDVPAGMPAASTAQAAAAAPAISAPANFTFIGGNTAVIYRPGGKSAVVDLNKTVDHPHPDEVATISPDGRKVAYVDGATGDLVLANIDGSHQVKVSARVAQCGAPVWSPDSRRVVITANTAHNEIETVNADGTGRSVTDSQGGCWPVFSADGTRIAFVDRNSHLVLTDAVHAGGHRTVTTTAKIRTVMSVSADGHAVIELAPDGCGCDDGLRHWSLHTPNVLDTATGKLTPLINKIGRVDSAYYTTNGSMVEMLNGGYHEPTASLVVLDASGNVRASYPNPVDALTKEQVFLTGV